MVYKENWGFRKMTNLIRNPKENISLAKNLGKSIYALAYLINNNNSHGNMLDDTRFKSYIVTPPVKDLSKASIVSDTEAGTALNKCRKKDGSLEIHPKYLKFLGALTEYLITDGKVNFKNFYIIKNNLKELIEANLYPWFYAPEDKRSAESLMFRDFFFTVFEDVNTTLGEASVVDNILQEIQYNDRYEALTWILLFSLYPNTGKNDLLCTTVLGPFRDAYKDKNYITPPSISCDASSYQSMCEALAAKYNCTIPDVLNNMLDFFDSKENANMKRGSIESYEYLHLMFLKSYEFYLSNKNDKKQLGEYMPDIINAVEIISSLGLDNEDYWLEYIQFLMLKANFYWKSLDHNNMGKILDSIELLLHDRYEITDKYKNLLVIIKRKQGINFNYNNDFENVLRTYNSSFFICDSNMKYERSKIKNNEAFMFRKWSKFDRACQAYDIADRLREYRRVYDPGSIFLLYSNMCRTYFYSHKFEESIQKVDEAYNYRKSLFNTNKTKYVEEFTATVKAYAEALMFRGIYADNQLDSKNYWKQADEKLKEIRSVMKDYNNKNSQIEYEEIYGRLHYYQNELDKSLTCFSKAINMLNSNKSKIHRRVTSYIYLGKINFSNDRNEDAYNYFKIAYDLSKELLNHSYFRYTKMVAAFNLGAFLYLVDEGFNLPLLEGTNEPVSSLSLINMSYEDINILMEDSDFIDEKYKGINARAFEVEKRCISTFKASIEQNEDMSNYKNWNKLKKEFLYFFVGAQ